MIMLTKVYWFGDKGLGMKTDITDAINWSSQTPLDTKGGVFTITLKNAWKEYIDSNNTIEFQEGDTLLIYAKNDIKNDGLDTSDNSTDLIMSAVLREYTTSQGTNNVNITLTSMDKSYIMLNRIWSNSHLVSDRWTAPKIIKDVIAQTNDLEGDGSLSVSALLVSEGGFIQDTRDDGSPFPEITYQNVLKPVYEWITDLSQIDNTNNQAELAGTESLVHGRSFRSYVDAQNRFHWYYPKDGNETRLNGNIGDKDTTITVDSTADFDNTGEISIGAERMSYSGKTATTFTGINRGLANTIAISHNDNDRVTDWLIFEVGTDNIKIVNLKKAIFDVTNHIIFDAGQDMRGKTITGSYFDDTTDSSTLKTMQVPMTDIARVWIARDYEVNTSRNAGEYPQFPNSYPVIPVWGATKSYTQVTSDTEYNDSLWERAKTDGEFRARNILMGLSSSRWRGTISLSGMIYTVGTLTEFSSAEIGHNRTKIRIMNSSYTLNQNGFGVNLEMEQDQKAIQSLTT